MKELDRGNRTAFCVASRVRLAPSTGRACLAFYNGDEKTCVGNQAAVLPGKQLSFPAPEPRIPDPYFSIPEVSA